MNNMSRDEIMLQASLFGGVAGVWLYTIKEWLS